MTGTHTPKIMAEIALIRHLEQTCTGSPRNNMNSRHHVSHFAGEARGFVRSLDSTSISADCDEVHNERDDGNCQHHERGPEDDWSRPWMEGWIGSGYDFVLGEVVFCQGEGLASDQECNQDERSETVDETKGTDARFVGLWVISCAEHWPRKR